MTARVQAVLDFLALAPDHRVRLARKAVGVPYDKAPLWSDPASWDEALEAGVIHAVPRVRPRHGDWGARDSAGQWFALEKVKVHDGGPR